MTHELGDVRLRKHAKGFTIRAKCGLDMIGIDIEGAMTVADAMALLEKHAPKRRELADG